MIKRTVEISQKPAHLAVRLDQLLIQPHDKDATEGSSIPCEDLGVLLVDHPQCTYTHAALAKLMEFEAAVVICGRNHMPAGILLPVADHSQVIWRIHDQLSVSKPLQKQLWKQIIQAKIRAQAMNLPTESAQYKRLMTMIRRVKSGDTSNHEAQAAKVYWSAFLSHSPFVSGAGGEGCLFRRDPNGTDSLNAMLNYGYAVLRAALARVIVAAGLVPALGLHHHQRSNAFCLADDLMEPLRPILDRRARDLYLVHERQKLDQPTKAGLLEVLTATTITGDFKGPLFVAIQRYIASLVRCFQGESKLLLIPVHVM